MEEFSMSLCLHTTKDLLFLNLFSGALFKTLRLNDILLIFPKKGILRHKNSSLLCKTWFLTSCGEPQVITNGTFLVGWVFVSSPALIGLQFHCIILHITILNMKYVSTGCESLASHVIFPVKCWKANYLRVTLGAEEMNISVLGHTLPFNREERVA